MPQGVIKGPVLQTFSCPSVSVGFLTCLKQSKCVNVWRMSLHWCLTMEGHQIFVIALDSLGTLKEMLHSYSQKDSAEFGCRGKVVCIKGRPINKMLRIHIVCSPGSELVPKASSSLKSPCQYTGSVLETQLGTLEKLTVSNTVFKNILELFFL